MMRPLTDLVDFLHAIWLSFFLVFRWTRVPKEDQEDIEDAWDSIDARYGSVWWDCR